MSVWVNRSAVLLMEQRYKPARYSSGVSVLGSRWRVVILLRQKWETNGMLVSIINFGRIEERRIGKVVQRRIGKVVQRWWEEGRSSLALGSTRAYQERGGKKASLPRERLKRGWLTGVTVAIRPIRRHMSIDRWRGQPIIHIGGCMIRIRVGAGVW